jgi:hypothetical protein
MRNFVISTIAVLGIGAGLFLAPGAVFAAETVPTVGCATVDGGAGCSLYFVELGWPTVLGVNAVEFVKFSTDVSAQGVDGTYEVNYLGGLCLIPGVNKIPLCPAAE